jgi:hypothetical protein
MNSLKTNKMNTTQINNKHYIECDFVMLPTDVSNRYNCTQDLIVKCIKSWTPIEEDEKKVNTLSISKNWSTGVLEYYQPQHLYILSNDKIKEGDWIGYPNLKNWVPVQYLGGDLTGGEKKIIATTDTSLIIKGECRIRSGRMVEHYPTEKSLPQIPQIFIKQFINEYNKENIVNKGMVEFEQRYDDNGKTSLYAKNWSIKLNQNNEISILISSKQNEDEVKEFVNTNYSFFTEDTRKKMILGINSWINKNNLKTK